MRQRQGQLPPGLRYGAKHLVQWVGGCVQMNPETLCRVPQSSHRKWPQKPGSAWGAWTKPPKSPMPSPGDQRPQTYLLCPTAPTCPGLGGALLERVGFSLSGPKTISCEPPTSTEQPTPLSAQLSVHLAAPPLWPPEPLPSWAGASSSVDGHSPGCLWPAPHSDFLPSATAPVGVDPGVWGERATA